MSNKKSSTKKKIKIKKKNDKKKASDVYQKMEHAEHIYKKPDTYTGSCEIEDNNVHIMEDNVIKQEMIKLTPAFYKCFDELLVNAHDHKKRMDKEMKKNSKNHYPVTNIKININEDDSITFFNDGDGIMVEYMEEHKMYPVELIFGTLLSSTNFDDNEKREWGGRNGYGAKLANIFALSFTVETVDHINKKKCQQTFSNNMKDKSKAKITSCKSKPYTKITWLPDYKRFGIDKLNDKLKALIKKRVYDIAGVTDKITKVYFNNKLLEVKTFEKYVDLYIGTKNDTKRVFDEGLGWQIVATCSDDDVFQQISFVNGINTIRGGTHVDYIADQIKTKMVEYLKKKKKLEVKPQIVKNQLKLFVNAYKIINPVFDSQTKETLKTPKNKFGSSYDISDKFIVNLSKTEIFEKIQLQTAYKNSQLLSKTDGKKSKKVKVNKLCDANKAGTSKYAKDCTIIFTEGDSAKTMAIAGIAEVGRDYYGVYPLRGKILNVRDAPTNQVMNCNVLNDIKKIIGLQNNTDYKKQYEKTGKWPLRYGKILIMTDQDHDGSHIKGLMMNIFDCMWPQLLELGFITSMITPIVKAFKGKTEKIFYTLKDYEKWKSKTNQKGYRIKYYKGLGTSTTKEAKEYFRNLKVINYKHNFKPINITPEQNEQVVNEIPVPEQNEIPDVKYHNKLDLAFNKGRANDRKVWLVDGSKGKNPDYNKKNMTFNEFVDEELINFSLADNERSLPNHIDGLKPAQRKVLFASFKRNLKNEIKVAQLAGYISEHAAYHHGEVSLEKTVKNMAQNYVGSNNLNYLEGIGQFGTRRQGGDDAAQSRYIFTKLSPLTRLIFKQNDDKLCNYLNDDGFPIEPEYYYPILPNILINGSSGIGTGFSSDIPQFNPMDISNYILNKLNKQELNLELKPWYRGFKGNIQSTSPGSYITVGKYEVVNESTIRITELPVGTWTEKYIDYLDKISVERGKESAKNFVRSLTDNSSDTTVDITIKMNPNILSKWSNKVGKDGIIEIANRLKLTSTISTSNMHMFDKNLSIKKFKTIEELIDDWYQLRINIYVKRRDYLLKNLKKELDIIKYKVKFIEEVNSNTLDIRNKKKQTIISNLESKAYPKFSNEKNLNSYDYLLNMSIYKLTFEEIEELKKKKEIKEADYNLLFSKTEKDLWIEDINEFKTNYIKYLNKFNIEYFNVNDNKKKSKGKKIKIKK